MTREQGKKSILVVDDEDGVRETICQALIKGGYDAVGAKDGPDTIIKVSQEKFDAMILDIRMPEMSGFDVLNVMKKTYPDTVVVILTAMPDLESGFKMAAMEDGVAAYLNKPCKIKELRDTLEAAFQQKNSCVMHQ